MDKLFSLIMVTFFLNACYIVNLDSLEIVNFDNLDNLKSISSYIP